MTRHTGLSEIQCVALAQPNSCHPSSGRGCSHWALRTVNLQVTNCRRFAVRNVRPVGPQTLQALI